MNADSGENRSVWMDTSSVPEQETLRSNINCDVCIVGAGIAGMTTAYLLSREGRRVVVLDDGRIGGGMTERTTAHLTYVLDDRFFELERMHGEYGVRLAAESHLAAVELIESIISQEEIDCDFERLDGYLFSARNDRNGRLNDVLDRELKAAQHAGITNVQAVDRAPLEAFDTGPCLRFPRQAQFHPLKYLKGLSDGIKRQQGRIFTETKAEKITGGHGATIETVSGAAVRAGSVVVATNTPVNDLVAIHTKQAPYMTYVIALRVPLNSVTRALYWDTEDPYHYVRLQTVGEAKNQFDLLIVGGEDHKTGQADDAEDRYARLEAWARERFAGAEDVAYRWSGQVMEPIDGVAFIGRNPMDAHNVYIATGDSGQGMTHGTIAGILLTDLICGRNNEWATLYDPGRKTLSAAWDFAKENVNVAAQFTDWATGGDVDSVEEIGRDDGALIRRGLSKIAVYRDASGELHEYSAKCPHLGCVVQWNADEKTWDCPCHGSRFDCLGKVINGPANSNLEGLK